MTLIILEFIVLSTGETDEIKVTLRPLFAISFKELIAT
jgi:hypothetical protein